LNDLYANASTRVAGSDLGSVGVTLPPYGSGVYTVSTTHDTLGIVNPILSVSGGDLQPAAYSLEQNYPNPFNPTTRIRYTIGRVVAPSGASSSGVEGPAANNVRLAVYDLLGREVAMLVNERQAPGIYQVTFDGAGLASGVYFYRLTAGSYVTSRTMILLK
jgi:hypothetical protein